VSHDRNADALLFFNGLFAFSYLPLDLENVLKILSEQHAVGHKFDHYSK